MEGDTLPSGYRSMTVREMGWMAAAGIWLPGNGTPPAAKLIRGTPIPEKSPWRSAGVGTVAVVVTPCLLRKPS